MFRKFSLTAALAGVLLLCPGAFAQRAGHVAGSHGFSGGRSFSGPAVSGRAYMGARGYYGGGYGGYRGYGYGGPRFGVGLGFYGPAYYPGYAAGCGVGFRDRFGRWHPAVGCYAPY